MGPVVLDPDLRERDAGEWSGLTRAEIETRVARLPDDEDRRRRARRAGSPTPRSWAGPPPPSCRIHELVPGGEAIAVTHGGLVYVIEGHFGVPFERLANLGGRWLEVGPDGLIALGERVVLIEPEEPRSRADPFCSRTDPTHRLLVLQGKLYMLAAFSKAQSKLLGLAGIHHTQCVVY